MATLKNVRSNEVIHTGSFHRFGRLSHTVDTWLDHVSVSRIHGIIEWHVNHWIVRDVSRNGIWLNSERLKPNQDITLSKGDCLRFANHDLLEFEVTSCAPPQDLLIAQTTSPPVSSAIKAPIVLDGYHLLPNDSAPEVAMFFDISLCKWCTENLATQQVSVVNDGDLVTISDTHWRLFIAARNESKSTEPTQDMSNLFKCEISLSQDEEHTTIKIYTPECLIDLKERSHHYLIAMLARYKAHAYQTRTPLEEFTKGWVSLKTLARDLGLTENHINILIHRARQQLVQQVGNVTLHNCLIERKKGHVRFAGKHFKILKGGILETRVGMD
ncbi:FHA domain-containing protein [Pseudoalteromonas rubra]|uniref:FHA domain-containing protein n=1 Tax=Pseudoalteromonas rubra TaxID=43658 RepID=A0A0F4QCU0_9GAMM|nr:FHA domain-containing protein [Pseudoalteromonas rubra]KJZ05501.1 hypothetical protein TW77_22620 [Pseudoalteromonas rubra]